jgi:tRNA-splicing ligase RtcB
MIEVSGKYSTSKIMIDQIEENCMSQIIQMVNHPAFTNPIAIMPDTHSGTGSVIGFTMSMGDKIIPNVIGVDISCGMLSYNIGKIKINHKELDDKIREKIPFGINVRKKPLLNFEREVNWSQQWSQWSWEWFLNLCKKIKIDPFYVQQSIGTLGSGNHFLELGESKNNGDIWITVHSGSRNLGKKICEYWQNIAFEKDVPDIKQMITEIKNTSQPSEIEEKIKKVKEELKQYKKSDLDWIDGDNKKGYIQDMKFASWYAHINRTYIMHNIIDLINNEELSKKMFMSDHSIPWIETVHNFIDFKDNIIRKGAIRSYIGEKMIIPFNMRDGILICEGKSNPEWNYSAPHGAGRVYSRTKAKQELNLEKFEDDMRGIFSTSVGKGTIDESPDAYKDSKIIEDAIQPTATILDRIIPIHNMKDVGGEKPWKKRKLR